MGVSSKDKAGADCVSEALKGTLGRNVRTRRRAQGLGKSAFCLMAGISRPTLDKIESGTADPKLSSISRMADALDVEPGELLE